MVRQSRILFVVLLAALVLAVVPLAAGAAPLSPSSTGVTGLTEVQVAVYGCSTTYLAGADVSWYKYGAAGTVYPVGTTTDSALLTFDVNAADNPQIVVKVTFQGRTVNIGPQTLATNTLFELSAVTAVVDFQDHQGFDIPIVAGNNLTYYAWGAAAGPHYAMPLAGGNGEACVLPGDYVFNMEDKGITSGSGQHNVATPYVFQTGAVTNGVFPDVWNCVQYYQFGFASNVQPFSEGIELLPANVKFLNPASAITGRQAVSEIKTYNVVAGQLLNLYDGTYSDDPAAVKLLFFGVK